MDEYKLQAVKKTVERLPGKEMDVLIAEVRLLDREIGDCYEDSAIEWDADTLALMMTMDACFILELLNSSLVFHSHRSDNIKRRETILDILKVENQVPLCILERILQLELGDAATVRNFLANKLDGCIGDYFKGYPFSPEENEDNEAVIASLIEGGAYHLLDLSRQVIANFLSNRECPNPVQCCGCNVPRGVSVVDEYLIPSAEKLLRPGTKLKLSTEGNFHFKCRSIRSSTLFLPQIIVADDTEIFLRNLVAFEECQIHHNSPIERLISRSMWIMDNLIDSKDDVKLFQS